jgi:2-oxoglutarate ferredoxin oxidoreductase subunit alpha
MAEEGKKLLTVEMSCGQMVEDVQLSVKGKTEVGFYGRRGGMVPTPTEILEQIRSILKKESSACQCCRACGTEVSR